MRVRHLVFQRMDAINTCGLVFPNLPGWDVHSKVFWRWELLSAWSWRFCKPDSPSHINTSSSDFVYHMCLRMAGQSWQVDHDTGHMRSRDISRDEDFFQHIYGIWMAFRIPGLNLSGKDSSGNLVSSSDKVINMNKQFIYIYRDLHSCYSRYIKILISQLLADTNIQPPTIPPVSRTGIQSRLVAGWCPGHRWRTRPRSCGRWPGAAKALDCRTKFVG